MLQPIAYDTETTGLSSFHGHRPFAMSICTYDHKCKYTVVGEDDLVPDNLILMNGGRAKIFHSAKFDVLMLEAMNMDVNGEIHDTMVMANIYDCDEKNLKLKTLAEKHLRMPPDEQTDVKAYMKKHKCESFADVPRELMEPYALKDAEMTMKLFQFYEKAGILENKTYIIEKKILKCLIGMEKRGVLLDRKFLVNQQAILDTRMTDIEATIALDYGEINIGSNKQLGEFLFDKEGLQCNAMSMAGNPVLDEKNLEQYDHPIVPLVIEYRKTAKLLKTYINGMLEGMDDKDTIHCSYWQLGAKTGRFSCRQPNLQNIPRGSDIRQAFICRPDYTNYYFDYSQIELRILAHYAKEQKMLDVLSDPDGDLHAETAELVFGEDFTKEQRSIAKTINFGIIYGMGPKKLAESLQHEYPEGNYTYNSAKAFINRYYFNYPAVRQFTWAVPRAILNKGFVTDIYGRVYKCDPKESYKSVNYLIQGCAASVLKNAMIKVDSVLRDAKSNMLLTIHDELVIEIHKDEEHLVKRIKGMMEDYDTFRVPLTVNIEKTTTNWNEKA